MPTFLVKNNVYQGTSAQDVPSVAADVFEPRAVFSLNASNQLTGTFWLIKNGQLVVNSVGPASYEIFDSLGASVGLSQSGILADANGQFKITPVSASQIQDLTHYVVRISIAFEGQNRIGYVGITLGE